MKKHTTKKLKYKNKKIKRNKPKDAFAAFLSPLKRGGYRF